MVRMKRVPAALATILAAAAPITLFGDPQDAPAPRRSDDSYLAASATPLSATPSESPPVAISVATSSASTMIHAPSGSGHPTPNKEIPSISRTAIETDDFQYDRSVPPADHSFVTRANNYFLGKVPFSVRKFLGGRPAVFQPFDRGYSFHLFEEQIGERDSGRIRRDLERAVQNAAQDTFFDDFLGIRNITLFSTPTHRKDAREEPALPVFTAALGGGGLVTRTAIGDRYSIETSIRPAVSSGEGIVEGDVKIHARLFRPLDDIIVRAVADSKGAYRLSLSTRPFAFIAPNSPFLSNVFLVAQRRHLEDEDSGAGRSDGGEEDSVYLIFEAAQ